MTLVIKGDDVGGHSKHGLWSQAKLVPVCPDPSLVGLGASCLTTLSLGEVGINVPPLHLNSPIMCVRVLFSPRVYIIPSAGWANRAAERLQGSPQGWLFVVVVSNGPKNMCKGPVLVAECGEVQWAVGEGGLYH